MKYAAIALTCFLSAGCSETLYQNEIDALASACDGHGKIAYAEVSDWVVWKVRCADGTILNSIEIMERQP